MYSINLTTIYLLICLHFLIILIWHHLKQSYYLSGFYLLRYLPDQTDSVLWNKEFLVCQFIPTTNLKHYQCTSKYQFGTTQSHFIFTTLFDGILENNSPLILFHSIYFVNNHHILLDLSLTSFIDLLYYLLFRTQ